MIPIRNQPIVFPTYNPILTQSDCIDDSERKPLIFKQDRPIELQFLREVGEEITCDLISPQDLVELTVGGDFDDPADWTVVGNWTIAAGVATSTNTGGAIALQQDIGAVTGTSYTLTYTITLPGGVTFTPAIGANGGTTVTASGTYSEVIVCGIGTELVFTASDAGAVLDDVSTIETVLENDCWTFPGWDFTEDAVTHTDGETTPITFDGLTAGVHYKVIISATDFTQGFAIIKNGTDTLGMHDTEVTTYYFVATATAFTINPSSDFDGGFISIDIYPHDHFSASSLLLTGGCAEAFVDVDLMDFVTYRKDFASVKFTPSTDIPEIADCKCYQIRFGSEEESWLSAEFEIATELDCDYVEVVAWNECEGWGFNHHTYRHRLFAPIRFTNPTYLYVADKTSLTDGMHKSKTRERSKQWVCRLTDGQRLDEAFHDAFSIMLQCEYFQVTDVYYDCPDGDYVPQWEETQGLGEVAPVQFNLRLKTDVIFNREGSCIPHIYNLRVLNGWTTPHYFKVMDGYQSDYLGTVFRLDSMIINGETFTPSERFFEMDSVTTTATGINGNLVHAATKGAGISNEIPQSVSDWINELIGERYPIRFYDDLSVVHYREDVEFEIIISISSYPNVLSQDSGPYIFTNTGKIASGRSSVDPYYEQLYVE